MPFLAQSKAYVGPRLPAMLSRVPWAPFTLTSSYERMNRGMGIPRVDLQSTVFRKARDWSGVMPASSSPISANCGKSRPAGAFTTGLWPSVSRMQLLYCSDEGGGGVATFAVALGGLGQSP